MSMGVSMGIGMGMGMGISHCPFSFMCLTASPCCRGSSKPRAGPAKGVATSRGQADVDDDDDGDDCFPGSRQINRSQAPGGRRLPAGGPGQDNSSRPLSGGPPPHLRNHESVHVARPGSTSAAVGTVERAALRAAAAAAASVARNNGVPSNAKYQW